jgi:hypothetical protein
MVFRSGILSLLTCLSEFGRAGVISEGPCSSELGVGLVVAKELFLNCFCGNFSSQWETSFSKVHPIRVLALSVLPIAPLVSLALILYHPKDGISLQEVDHDTFCPDRVDPSFFSRVSRLLQIFSSLATDGFHFYIPALNFILAR